MGLLELMDPLGRVSAEGRVIGVPALRVIVYR